MHKNEKRVKNFDADQPTNVGRANSTVSATEATGMMFNPPMNDEELRSLRSLHELQSTEFAATEFGEIESDLGFEVPSDMVAGVEEVYSKGRRYHPELDQVDPDINYVNSHDDNHASMKPLSTVDWSNGESGKV